MKFENTKVMNFEGAFRGMRNPKESWNMSDSVFHIGDLNWEDGDYEVMLHWAHFLHPEYYECNDSINEASIDLEESIDLWLAENGVLTRSDDYAEVAFIGPKDMKLAQSLIAGGSEHRKFLRQIVISVDITAPLYW